MNERRRSDPPDSPIDYLRRVPALVLLDRMIAPIIAVDSAGVLAYANPAFARMLGYPDADTLADTPISALLRDRADTSDPVCLDALRASRDELVEWRHVEEFFIRTTVSDSLLLRSTDPLVVISINDVSDWLWSVDTMRTCADNPNR